MLLLAAPWGGGQAAYAQTQVLDKKTAKDLMDQGEYIKALEIYKNIDAKKSTLESTLDVARTHMLLRNYAEAEFFFKNAMKYDGCPTDAYCDLGDVLMYNGKYIEARKMYFTYATNGGDPTAARGRIFSCDSANDIAGRKPFYTIYNERRINTKYSDFSPTVTKGFVSLTSDRPIDYQSTDREEMAVTLSMMQGAGSEAATLLLLRNAQNPTDTVRFNRVNLDSTAQMFHSVYEGDKYDVFTSDKDKQKLRNKREMDRRMQEKMRDKKKKIYGGTGRPYLNMYIFSRENVKDLAKGVLGSFVWTKPEIMQAPLNTGEHTGPCCFTPDGNTIYFCYAEQMTDVSYQNGLTSHVGIMISHKTEDGWSYPIDFPYNNRAKYSVGHPCITQDGKYLIFSSNMPGTLGSMDLFYCELSNEGQWLPPVNLGPIINTPRDEKFPTLDNDGTLYFSSYGHPGLGGLDIFRAKGKFFSWTAVENLRQPINSSSDDFSMVFLSGSKTEGLFSSNRPGGYGGDDIYSFKAVPTEVIAKDKPIISVSCINRKDSAPVESVVLTLMNKKTKKGDVVTTGTDGLGDFAALSNTAYSLSSTVAGFLPTDPISIATKVMKAGNVMKITLPLNPLSDGGSFKVNNVNYDYGKAVLKKAAYKQLDKVVKFMQTNPTVKIELSSHSDSRGSLKTNMALSQKRAEACVVYLVKKGISPDRVVSKGYGPTQPLVKNAKTEKQHAKNRRTEVKILSMQ